MKPVRGGKLRLLVQILVPNEAGKDKFAETQLTYTPGQQTRANIVPGASREFWYAKQVRADITHEITMRYGVTIGPRYRVLYNQRTFEIGPALNTDERNRELRFTATEILGLQSPNSP